MSQRSRRWYPAVVTIALAGVALGAAGCSGGGTLKTTTKSNPEMVGLFRLSAGQTAGGQVTGSWFRSSVCTPSVCVYQEAGRAEAATSTSFFA